ncbi:heme exporter protein CcmD [Pseudomonas oryzihabitans]|uniref:heme exporter protein CcmD n=1 Tax=Pseudomonas oryzihabitans TaxID=47885 RepID=UPI0028946B9E|nr:heme exporter protein CcmD [Pseudomonas oryzihabitans]MDT3718040.1 heme exporter protein CcmD [Pseudomonas oryzihabitans]
MSGIDWVQALSMGRHGLYVWPAFGLTLAILLGLLLHGWQARRRVERDLRQRWRRERQP